MNDFYLIARITSISGSEGFLNLQIITDFAEKLVNLKEVYIDFFGSKKKFLVEDLRQSKKSSQIKFKRFNSLRELQILLGRDVFISGKNLTQLPKGSYFIHDLIDVEVHRDNIILGRIREVMNLPANDVFVIVDDEGNELLIPFVLDFIEQLDLKNKKLILKSGVGEYEDDEN